MVDWSRYTIGMVGSSLSGLALLVVLAGCPASVAPPAQDDGETPTAAELFTLITETDPYEQWAQFPGSEGTIDSAPPHGPMARVFINALVEQGMQAFDGELPDGAIIVKERIGSAEGDTASALNIMWKVTGFDPNNNDWFWADVSPSGEVNAEGKIAGCSACHSGVRANDYVFLHQF